MYHQWFHYDVFQLPEWYYAIIETSRGQSQRNPSNSTLWAHIAMRDTPPVCIYSGIAHHTSLFDRSIFGTRSALWSILQMPQNISGIFWQILAKTTTDQRRSQASRSTLEKTVLVNSLEFAAVTQWAKWNESYFATWKHGILGEKGEQELWYCWWTE